MKEFLRRLFKDPATLRKFFVALIGAATTAISLGLLPEDWSKWVTVAVAFLTAIGVYGVGNAEDKENP